MLVFYAIYIYRLDYWFNGKCWLTSSLSAQVLYVRVSGLIPTTELTSHQYQIIAS